MKQYKGSKQRKINKITIETQYLEFIIHLACLYKMLHDSLHLEGFLAKIQHFKGAHK